MHINALAIISLGWLHIENREDDCCSFIGSFMIKLLKDMNVAYVVKIEHHGSLVLTGKDIGNAQWSIDFANLKIDVSYCVVDTSYNESNQAIIAIAFGVAKSLCEVLELYYDCNRDTGIGADMMQHNDTHNDISTLS